MDIRDGIPPTKDGMVFEYYELDSETMNVEKLTKEDLIEVIKLMGKVRLGVEPFNQLSESAKRHFVVFDRSGNSELYTVAKRKQRKRQREAE